MFITCEQLDVHSMLNPYKVESNFFCNLHTYHIVGIFGVGGELGEFGESSATKTIQISSYN